MATFNNINIKQLNEISQIVEGNYLIVENDAGTNILNYKNFVVQPSNTSFYSDITTLSSGLISLSASTKNSTFSNTVSLRANTSTGDSVVDVVANNTATSWTTIRTLTPTVASGVYLRGIVEANIQGFNTGVASGALFSRWYFDINNSTFTSAIVGTDVTTGSAPQFRILVSGTSFLLQIQSSNGITTFTGLSYLKCFLPAGYGTSTNWTIS